MLAQMSADIENSGYIAHDNNKSGSSAERHITFGGRPIE
jgi:hypothetical protein